MTPKILAFAGSSRSGSFNKKLIAIAAQCARDAGADVTLIDLAQYSMPIYNGDLEDESGLPENAKKLKELMKSHHGFLISTPEYNSSIPPLLKNTIDWASRRTGDEKPLEAFTGKVVGLMAASPGGLGGLRCLFHVRDIFLNINAIVLPNQLALSSAGDAFDDNDKLKDDDKKQKVNGIANAVVDTVRKLNA